MTDATLALPLRAGERVERRTPVKHDGRQRVLVLTAADDGGRVLVADPATGAIAAELDRSGIVGFALPAGDAVLVRENVCLWLAPPGLLRDWDELRQAAAVAGGGDVELAARADVDGRPGAVAATARGLHFVTRTRVVAAPAWTDVAGVAVEHGHAAVVHADGAVRLSGLDEGAAAALARLAAVRVQPDVALPPPDAAVAWLVPRAALADEEALRAVARVGGGSGAPVPPPRVVAVTDRRLLVVEDGNVLHEWALADVAAAGYEQSVLEDRLLLAVPAASRYLPVEDGGNGLTVALALQRAGSAPASARTLELRSTRDGSSLLVAVGLVTGVVATLVAVALLATGGHLVVAGLELAYVGAGFASVRRVLRRPWAPPRPPGAARRALTLAEEAAPAALAAVVGAVVPAALLLAAMLVPWALFHAAATTRADGRL